jgi:transcriptional regulator with XRE-family HTH domain
MDQILTEKFRDARRSAGWSQKTVAERIDVDHQAIKRLEQGVGSMATLTTVIAALDFHLTGLAPGSTQPEQLGARRRQPSISLDEMAARTGIYRAAIASLENGGGPTRSLVRMLKVIAPTARRRAPERSYWGGDATRRTATALHPAPTSWRPCDRRDRALRS